MRGVFLSFFLLIHPILASADSIRIATEGAFPPFNFINDAGEIAGFERELGDALCARAGIDCAWVLNDWESIIPGLRAGRYDTIMAGMAATPSRSELVAFSVGYIQGLAVSSMVGRVGNEPPLEPLIAVQAKTIHADYLADKGASFTGYPTVQAAIAALVEGRADLLFGSQSNLTGVVRASNGRLAVTETIEFPAAETAMAFRKDDSALRLIFNRAIDEMENDGSLEVLRQKWFAGGDGSF